MIVCGKFRIAAIAVIIVFGAGGALRADTLVGAGRLQVALHDNGDGVGISGITDGGIDLLNAGGGTEIFTLFITRPGTGETWELPASAGWGQVTISSDGTDCSVALGSPSAPGLPVDLSAAITLSVTGARSRWHIAVNHLADCSLMDIHAPRINILAPGDDYFLFPRYSGILTPDPVAANMTWHRIYPAGWHASMAFMAYYNDIRGIYFGFHDPGASVKTFDVSIAAGGIAVEGQFAAPDRSVAGNDWAMPGEFALDLFDGDWFTAATMYRDWVFAEADYRPPEDPGRRARHAEMGAVSVWATISGGEDPADVETLTLDFAQYMGVPAGLTWYMWNYKDFDDDYPEYFPERTGMADAVEGLQAADVRVVPYINGRMFDTDLDGTGPSGLDFAVDGAPYAVRDDTGGLVTQSFNGNIFAVMCPTQLHWRDILVDAGQRLTAVIGAAGLYVDQAGAARPAACMASGHGHPLGGGNWWRTGYRDLFQGIHDAAPGGTFITTESGADSLMDQVDGFMVQGWQANGMVPAFQAVYAGHTILFGAKTGVSQYADPQFYCKLAQAFAHGIQPGRFYTSIQTTTGPGETAPIFVRRLARMYHKLNVFLTDGAMAHPLDLAGIPTITCTWQYTYDGDIVVTIPAIQTGTWVTDGDPGRRVAVTFVNASMTETIPFSFSFDAADYGMTGPLFKQKITETADDPPVPVSGTTFTESVTLAPMDAAAWIVAPPTPTPTPVCIRSGDVTGDGDITSDDAQRAFEIVLEFFSPTDRERCAADCNGDGIVTSGDAQQIFDAVFGGGCVDPVSTP